MSESNDYNEKAWDKIAEAEEEWFSLVSESEISAARSGDLKIKLTPTRNVPAAWLENLAQKSVLCLAGGGGRQGPLLAAAGARTTIVDISEKQLERDRQVGERDDLRMEFVAGDMSSLSMFTEGTFDLIINPTAVCYVPDVQPVWEECFRVLKPGGELIAGMMNPNNFLFDPFGRDEGELIATHKIPYSDWDLSEQDREDLKGTDQPIEYGHSLADLMGGQVRAGFQITGFYEDRWGGEDALSELIAVFFCTRAKKPG